MTNRIGRGIRAIAVLCTAGCFSSELRATTLIYEPFNYTLTNTAGPAGTQGVSGVVGSTNGGNNGLTPATGYRWYPTSTAFAGNAAGSYQILKDGAITADDLPVSGLLQQSGTNAMSLGGYGYTPKLAALPSQIQAPVSGTTSVWYSFVLRVNDLNQQNYLTEADSTHQAAAFPVPGAPVVAGVAVGSIGSLFNTGAGQENGNPSAAPGLVQVRPIVDANGNFVLDANNKRTFNIGISDKDTNPNVSGGNTNGTVFDTTAHSEGEAIFIVGRFDLVSGTGNDVANLYINPDLSTFGGSAPASPTITDSIGNTADPAGISSIWFRQSGGPGNNQATPDSYTVDEIRMGTSYADVAPNAPEPSAAAIMGFAACGLLARRRKRR